MRRVSRTPKVFVSSYRPPATKARGDNRYGRFLLVILAFLVAVLLVSRLPVFLLKEIELEGEVTSKIAGTFESLRGKSVFSPAISRVQNDVLRRYLAVKSVNCRRGLPNSLKCSVSLRKPKIIWRDKQGGALVDETGFLYERVERADDSILVVVDNSAQVAPVGTVVVSAEVIEHYYSLAELLASSGILIEQLEINDTIYHFDARLRLPDGKTVLARLTTTVAPQLQSKSLLALLARNPEAVSNYVDLRVPGYIYTR